MTSSETTSGEAEQGLKRTLGSGFVLAVTVGGRAIARTSLKGLCIVIVLYVLLNAAVVWSVSLSSVAGNDLALARALELAFSPTAAGAVVVAAVLILLNQQNLAYMGASRILHALAVDGLASKRAQTVGRLSPCSKQSLSRKRLYMP